MLSSFDIEIISNIVISAIFGLIIGFDRQMNNKPAGIRTQMLICVGSALLSTISIHLALQYRVPGSLVNPDPARLMAQIIAGIGFLGAGVILKDNNRISGVTTAATIWITACVGIAVGAGYYIPAGVVMLLVLLLHPLAKIQFKYGLKSVKYIVQIPREDWDRLIRILDVHKAKYILSKTSQKQAQFIVYTSHNEKGVIAKDLNDAKLDFSIFDDDE